MPEKFSTGHNPFSEEQKFMDGNMLKEYEIEMENSSRETIAQELEKYREYFIRYSGGIDYMPNSIKPKLSKLLDVANRRGIRWNPSTRSVQR